MLNIHLKYLHPLDLRLMHKTEKLNLPQRKMMKIRIIKKTLSFDAGKEEQQTLDKLGPQGILSKKVEKKIITCTRMSHSIKNG